jgi:hypothetical protein
MKILFLKNYQLSPTDVKIKFNKEFPNINLNDKNLNNYIHKIQRSQ